MARGLERFRLGGSARLWVDTRNGPVSALGRVVDLTLAGCRVVVQRRIDPNGFGRVGVDVNGSPLWFPVVVRRTEREPDGWLVDCEFDRPTEEKQAIVRELLADLSKMRGN